MNRNEENVFTENGSVQKCSRKNVSSSVCAHAVILDTDRKQLNNDDY